jgi:hypothetical protein
MSVIDGKKSNDYYSHYTIAKTLQIPWLSQPSFKPIPIQEKLVFCIPREVPDFPKKSHEFKNGSSF